MPIPSSGTTNYSHTANKLTGSTGNTEKTYTHDNAGNITSNGTRTFVYNQNSRLVQVTEGSSVIAEYAYDEFGRRVKKTVGSEITHYHYDLSGLLISETDGSGSPIRDYVYLNGEPIAMKVYGSPDAWYYFLNDHLGTPQKMVDRAGAIVWAAGYLPFGEAQLLTADVENNLRFSGQYYDAETGLHYNWHRYYDPETGRYITADPIGLKGGINLYVYVNGNPIGLTDPFGLKMVEPIEVIPSQQPFREPWDRYPGPRAPRGSSSGCRNAFAEYCDDDGWCCDYDMCSGTCKVKCPMIGPVDKTSVKKCIKSHIERISICNGKIRRHDGPNDEAPIHIYPF